jgi:hypothetical protein
MPSTPTASETHTAGSPGPRIGHAVKPYVSPASPRAPVRMPARSKPRAATGLRDSGTCRAVTASTSAAIGTLIRKMYRQLPTSTSQPPRNGPSAPPMPPSPDQAPIARARSARSNEASRMASAPGVSSAPPTPCRTRAAISVSMFGASPHSSDATANQLTPTRKIRLRPNRSPSDPPSRISAARLSA